ncbi:MAC/perforin domain-containing protein [Leeuwenhoekiella polynyae]|uniref:MACPF protein D3 domain-containing protein n=1 Tax=Leeuwenhoekiella polynyae TaxID=1550906 RepID=A0A4Q0P7L2_9FLAO|nr:MAC/perforin domain-containing protein [Leeuwenhoekiella polynyae]RXG21729.1 hypothetical protein DSM02_1974 [Leeuwenhoekiella polynyae]
MNNKIKILCLLIVVFLVSCSDEDSLNDVQENNIESDGVIVLKERDLNSPLVLSKLENNDSSLIERSNSTTKGLISFDDYLGRSYKLQSIDYSNNLDLGFPVVDMNKLSSDYSDFILSYGLNLTNIDAFAYSNFDRYTSNSKKTNTINGGFSLSLGLFKIGAKSTMKEIFSESKISENNRVFGELNILYKKARYKMLSDSDFVNKLSTTYLTDSFKELLYNRTPSQIFSVYGGVVLTDFVTGGKAQAMYTGIYTETEETETKESAMNTTINASFGFSDDSEDEVGADFGIGRDYANSQSFSNKITNLELSVRTIGGIGNISSFSAPQNINNYSIDLSGWSNSLSNESTHSLIGISENGLVPLSDFMLERNLSKRFERFYDGDFVIKNLEEPKIYIRVADDITRGSCVVHLGTRNGDNIILEMSRDLNSEYNFYYANGEPNLDARRIFLENLIDKYSDIYKLEIVGEFVHGMPSLGMGPRMYDLLMYRGVLTTFMFANQFGVGSDIMTNNIGEHFKKFVYNGMTYLLSDENDTKLGYSIYDDYILDTYGIRDFVGSLPSTTINPDNLRDYLLIAL